MLLDQSNESIDEIIICLTPDTFMTPTLCISYAFSRDMSWKKDNIRGRDHHPV